MKKDVEGCWEVEGRSGYLSSLSLSLSICKTEIRGTPEGVAKNTSCNLQGGVKAVKEGPTHK